MCCGTFSFILYLATRRTIVESLTQFELISSCGNYYVVVLISRSANEYSGRKGLLDNCECLAENMPHDLDPINVLNLICITCKKTTSFIVFSLSRADKRREN